MADETVTENPTDDQLSLCPFCDGQAEIRTDLPGASGRPMASCKQCGACAFWRKWNWRAGTGPSGELAEIKASMAYRHSLIGRTQAENARLRAILSEFVNEFGCTIEQYHRNGPTWTSADGEMFDVSVVLDREPLIERARAALAKATGETE